jgi:hypothetical protein
MRIQIDGHNGAKPDELYMEFTDDEASQAAVCLREMCKQRQQQCVQLNVLCDGPQFRRLFSERLARMNFVLIDLADEDRQPCGVALMYRDKGWNWNSSVKE